MVHGSLRIPLREVLLACVVMGVFLPSARLCAADDTTPPNRVTATKPTRPAQGQKPIKVGFTIYVVDIDEINGHDQSFAANFVLTLRWKDERLAHSNADPHVMPLKEVWHPKVVLANRQAGVRMPMEKLVEVMPDGSVTYRQQYVGPLSQPLRLHDFPLDRQEFSIQFVTPNPQMGNVEFFPAKISEDLIGGGMSTSLSLPDWEVLDHRVEVTPYQLTKNTSVPGFSFIFNAKRHSSYFIWQAAMPLVLIVMMSWVPFWVDPTKAELQFAIAGSSVLTLIAFRFTLGGLLPNLPYLTRMDHLTISGTVLVFGAFLQVVLTSLLAQGPRRHLARRVDIVCRILFPLCFLALAVWSIWC